MSHNQQQRQQERQNSSDEDNNRRREGNSDEISFEQFLDGWLERQQRYLDELMHANANSKEIPEEELKSLISRVLGHYQQYYEAKSTASRRDVFVLFSPPWFSTYERTFLWIAGFKPGLLLRILNKAVKNLSEDQWSRVKRIDTETKVAERELNQEMASIQERVVSPGLVDLARRGGRLIDGETLDRDSEFQSMKEAMEAVVVAADYLRVTVTRKLVEVLNHAQAISFLTAATQLQVRIRVWGSQMERRRTN
ncbi:protein DOG1-like 4 [Papaver somniferum]|uniref:protein DOG1-like 4 n=1 Tax=Papaver somniferum TaxID=3469 RepID=UPI000E701B66|nr:protein DOG1-like 4 [Papaver somniferum]